MLKTSKTVMQLFGHNFNQGAKVSILKILCKYNFGIIPFGWFLACLKTFS